MLIAYASVPLIALVVLAPLALLFRKLLVRVYGFMFGGRQFVNLFLICYIVFDH